MNEPPEPTFPEERTPSNYSGAQTENFRRQITYWIRYFFACNPFYLVSAALLLYGFHRVSIDSNFLSEETAHLVFNFASLQTYELLLVVTAIFLASRRIWYDSTLLVGLENMLLLVPFILISQAALINVKMIWAMCLFAGVMAIIRSAGSKRFIKELNLPLQVLVIGSGMLLVNVVFPVIYRMLHELKFGTRLEAGPAYYTNEYAWLFLMPALCALGQFLTRSRATGELLPQRGWLPFGLYSLWLLGTGVHLYCLGYVYDFDLRPELLAPAIWTLVWILRGWILSVVPNLNQVWQRALLIAPAVATLMATSQTGSTVFLVLTMLNACFYFRIYLIHREQRLALHLTFISLAALIGWLPELWLRGFVVEFSRAKCIGAAGAGYLLLWATLSRDPARGVFGAVISAAVVIFALGEQQNPFHWATQAGLVFFLAHSLRWDDAKFHAGRLRLLAAVIWVLHALFWIHIGGQPWMGCAAAALMLGVFFAARLLSGRWGPIVVPIAAIVVSLAGPADSGASTVQTAPAGLLAIIGSFLLLALGTVAALTRHRWHHLDSK